MDKLDQIGKVNKPTSVDKTPWNGLTNAAFLPVLYFVLTNNVLVGHERAYPLKNNDKK